ncbi:MAG: HAMP domain-containing histidine kinase [Firmicutes bacterium]|nr:HAMP domain-containing histidine kinase [Bacillota bacterium]
MKIIDFLKDKGIFIIIVLFITAFQAVILWAFNLNIYLITIIIAINIFGIIALLSYEYMKKRRFYNNIVTNIENLDRKHLLSEMVFRPNFIEGEIFYDVLKLANKSMNDEILKYKLLSKEYKEYIETWVHEVKTPIASSRLIIENNKNEITENLLEEIEKIDKFVEQALYYSKISNLENDYIIKQVKLEYIVNETIKKHSKVLIDNKAKIIKNNLDFIVFADLKWIKFVLNQIIENSIKYKKEEFTLEFIAKEEGSKVILSIKDNGIGISNKDIDKVFKKGFTGENGRKIKKSTGIGLYLCYKLCKKMGLLIDIKSDINIGTTVNITFPKNKMINFEES